MRPLPGLPVGEIEVPRVTNGEDLDESIIVMSGCIVFVKGLLCLVSWIGGKTWSCRWVLVDLVHHSQWMNDAPTNMPFKDEDLL